MAAKCRVGQAGTATCEASGVAQVEGDLEVLLGALGGGCAEATKLTLRAWMAGRADGGRGHG